jgi:tRNA pseudouridine55 synthase
VAVTGVLVVDKPAGPTSFEVVQRVKRLLRAEKAGHTGTLDPQATGVLGVCLGEAVKLQRYLTEGDKVYQAEVAFGAATDTDDAKGRVIDRGDPSDLTAARVAAALAAFIGEIDQVPPMYSAVRVGGRRLHQAARAGEEVERQARRVRIHSLELLAFEPARDGLARARLAVRCGKGTYMRALAADLGRALGVPAHLAALRRAATGPFTLAQAIPLAEAEALAGRDPAALRARLVAPEEAVGFLPAVRLTALQAQDLLNGRALALAPPRGPSRALDPEGRLVAVCGPDASGTLLRPLRVLAKPITPRKH